MFISLISSDVLIVKCVIWTPKCRKYVILVVSWKFRDLIVKFFSVLVFQVGSCFFRSVFFFSMLMYFFLVSVDLINYGLLFTAFYGFLHNLPLSIIC